METKSIKKNTIYNALKTGSSILFPLITFPYISRVLLAENVGKINFGLSIVSYFSLIASLGINTYAIRECSGVREDKEKLEDTASQIYSINIVTTIIAYLALATTLVFVTRISNYRSLIIVQSLSIVAATIGADWLNSSLEDFKYITLRTIAFQVLSLFLMFVFVRTPKDYMNYAMISLVSSAGANIFNVWYRRRYCRLRFKWNIRRNVEWNKHFIPILYMFVMILAQTIFNSVDSTMLGVIHGDREVGIYSSAHKIMNIVNQVVASLAWVVMPRMAAYFADENYIEINRLLRKVLSFYITIGFPCAIGMIMLADDFVLAISGEDFVEAAPVLKIMMIGFVFSLYGGNFLGNTILLPSKQEKYYMVACCIMAVFNVIANYFLIPGLGARGAAITTTLCSVLMLIMLELKKNKDIKIEGYINIVIPPLVGCILIVLVCLICRTIDFIWFRLPISVFLSVIAYFIAQFFLKNSLVLETGGSIIRYLNSRKLL